MAFSVALALPTRVFYLDAILAETVSVQVMAAFLILVLALFFSLVTEVVHGRKMAFVQLNALQSEKDCLESNLQNFPDGLMFVKLRRAANVSGRSMLAENLSYLQAKYCEDPMLRD